jgi:regulator of protease activity HflC (stomatin/prohibitin superfamily)
VGGLEKLVDFVLSWIRILRFWIIVNENEHGIVLRFGRWERLDPKLDDPKWYHAPTFWRFIARCANGYRVGPGLHIKFFAWDEEMICSSATETQNLRVQSLSCLDGTKLQVSAAYKYEIADAFKYYMEIGDEENFLDDLAYGAISDEVLTAERWPFDIAEMKKRIKSTLQREAREYGFRIRTFKFENLTPANTLRLFNE